MEYLSEEHVKLLLTKEWLVKSDSESSTPYLLKFYASTVDLTCCVLITDTKNAWGEVLSSNQIARRWRDCNSQNSTSFAEEEEEEAWRIKCLEFLTSAHSIGGLSALSLELVESNFSDFAFTLGGGNFRWRWETFHLGPRMSADVLSKHLILPLISMSHIAFSSADPLGATSEADLEKSVDKVGRTARRTLDTHVRNALSKPVLATTLRRITAMFNFVPDLPRIVADAQAPDLTPPSPPTASRARATTPPRHAAPARSSSPEWPSPVHATHTESKTEAKASSQAKPPSRMPAKPIPSAADDSVTEEEPEEDDHAVPAGKGKVVPHSRWNTNSRDGSPVRSVPPKRATPDQSPPPKAGGSRKEPSPPASSSPPPPKKAKKAQVSDSSDEEDSEQERKKRLARLKGSSTRGAKQPVKRGGRRF
ncbi:hypothetical protein K466DRAFT_585918 [Polyporus arcularius HHB13444]|uniref:XLF-like N-terminal domain-containing protein n=1 Tax=Polyporus arcularius HHB13444 TaxID=1314778 RepID=A0A5C3PDY8_9APHY|nr:hypothetical protein K466DRAFT_585918 [Polyporus arcularius HHB13444]